MIITPYDTIELTLSRNSANKRPHYEKSRCLVIAKRFFDPTAQRPSGTMRQPDLSARAGDILPVRRPLRLYCAHAVERPDRGYPGGVALQVHRRLVTARRGERIARCLC